MRNLSLAMEQRLRRVDPTSRTITEVRAELQSDIRARQDQWAKLDSIPTNVELLADGGVRLKGTASSGPGNAVHNAAALAQGDPGAVQPYFGRVPAFSLTSPYVLATAIEWKGSEANTSTIVQVSAYVDPQPNGGLLKTVANWFCEIYQDVTPVQLIDGPDVRADLQLLAATSLPAGAGAGTVTFDFSSAVHPPQPKLGPAIYLPFLFGDPTPHAYTVILIYGLTSGNAPATNVGFGYDSTRGTTASSAGSVIGGIKLRHDIFAPSLYGMQPSSTLPTVQVTFSSYTAATIMFTQSANHLHLPSSPLNPPEFLARAETPTGTSVVTQVATSAGGTYVTYTDGQSAADLGLATQQDYYWKATLNPDGAGTATPILRQAGVTDVSTTDLSDVTQVERVSWAIDPTTHVAEVPELHLRALHDGERDFSDAWSQVLSGNAIGNIVIRLWAGDKALGRADWVHLDDFLIDDYDLAAAEAMITAVSPLVLLRGALPRFSSEVDAYPNSDVSAGGWAFTGANSYNAALADNNGGIGLVPWDDTSFVLSPVNPSNAALTVGLQGIAQPQNIAATQVQIQFRAALVSGSVLPLTVQLFNGTTQISTLTVQLTQSQVLNFALLPTATQLAAIAAASWNGNLRLKFIANGTGQVKVTWARLAVLPIRNPLVYPSTATPAETPQTVSADLLDNQINLPARYRGPDMTNISGLDGSLATTLQIEKTISSPAQGNTDLTIAKNELDSVAYLAGGFWTSTEGQVVFRRLYDVTVTPDGTVTYLARTQEAIRATIPSEEVAEPIQVSPGFRYRTPEFWALWGFNSDTQQYTGEARGALITALQNLGDARVDPIRRLDARTSQWIASQQHANGIVQRQASYFGYGLMVWRFRTTYAHPELELGDMISLQTDRFLTFDPSVPRAIAGLSWVQAIVTGIFDEWGRDLAVWVPLYTNISPGSGSGTATPPTIVPPPIPDLTVPRSPIHGCVTVTGDASDPALIQLSNPTNSNVYVAVYEFKRSQSGDSDNEQVIEYYVGPFVVTGGSIVTGYLERRDQRDTTAIKSSLLGYTAGGSFGDFSGFYGGMTPSWGTNPSEGLGEFSPIGPDQFPVILPPGASLFARTHLNAASLTISPVFDEIAITATDFPNSDGLQIQDVDLTLPRATCCGWVQSGGSVSGGPFVQLLNPADSGVVLFVRDVRTDSIIAGVIVPIWGARVTNYGLFQTSGAGFAGATLVSGFSQRRDGRSLLGTVGIMQGTNLNSLNLFNLGILTYSDRPGDTSGGPGVEAIVVARPRAFPWVLLPGQALVFTHGATGGSLLKLYAEWDESGISQVPLPPPIITGGI